MNPAIMFIDRIQQNLRRCAPAKTVAAINTQRQLRGLVITLGMFRDKSQCIIGTKIAVAGIADRKFPTIYLDKKDIQKMFAVYLTEEAPKVAWTPKKGTAIAVQGADADPQSIERAKELGATVLSSSDWLGLDIGAGATRIDAYLTALTEAGFSFNTGTNEADSARDVLSAPRVAYSDNPVLRLKPHEVGRPRLWNDAMNTLVHDVQRRFSGWFKARTYSPNRGEEMFLASRDSNPEFWYKPITGNRYAGHDAIRASTATRVIPAEALIYQLEERSGF